MDGRTTQREGVSFVCGGVSLAAWLYPPRPTEAGDESPGVPCVVLAHDFGATRAARLDAFARRFASAGYPALVFDYRDRDDLAATGQPRRVPRGP
jgi:dienelactone hydrolase